MKRLCAFVSLIGCCASSVRAAGYQKGLDLALFSKDVDPHRLSFFLDNAQASGIDHVSINSWWFQDNINSTQVGPNFSKYSASDDTIRQVIDAVHARGMSVQLRPIVDLTNDPSHWRGQITGGMAWFNNAGGYGDYIRHMADIAQERNVAIFSVGVELETVQTQEANWRNLVSSVRSRYDGELVYGANWGNPAIGNAVNWWDAVDLVGIDAYYPLTGVNNPTPAQLQTAWTNRANQIEAWRNTVAPDKQVIFTEVGYQALEGANVVPYGATSSTIDMREQADAYQALLSAMSGRSWFSGAYWWAWDPNNPRPTMGDYQHLGKPAYDVMSSFYVPGYTIGTTWGPLIARQFNSAGTQTIDLGGGTVSAARVIFDQPTAGTHTFNNGTIVLARGGGITVTNVVTSAQTFNNSFALSGPTIFANWSNQRLTINGAITSATPTRNQLALFGNGNGLLAGSISDGIGTIGLFKAGDGTWTVSGNNSYTGETYIGAGNMHVQHANALGSTTGKTIVSEGASLQVNGNVTVAAEPLELSGHGAGGQGALQLLDQFASGAFDGDITVVGTSAKIANRSFNNGSINFTLGGRLRGGGANSELILWGSNSSPGFFRLTGSGSDFVGTMTILATKVTLLGGTNTISPSAIVNLDTSGVIATRQAGFLDLNGTSQTIAGLSSVTRATMPRVMNGGAGASTLVLNTTGSFNYAGTISDSIALVKTGSGNQTLAGANTYTGGTAVNSGTLTLAHVSAAGAGTLNVAGGRAVFIPGLSGAARSSWIDVDTSDAAIDLTDNDLVVGSAKPRAAVEALVVSARSGGDWDGFGLTSSSARDRVDHATTLGVMSGADFFSIYGDGATFSGQSVVANETLVKYTWYGDADFSGAVTFDDYARIDGGFNNGRSGWINGDFDLSGQVNFDDYALIDLAFNSQSGPLRAVPEPGAVAVLCASLSICRRTRRRMSCGESREFNPEPVESHRR